jgi:hypothetical protein
VVGVRIDVDIRFLRERFVADNLQESALRACAPTCRSHLAEELLASSLNGCNAGV